jgi:hypothetical protein
VSRVRILAVAAAVVLAGCGAGREAGAPPAWEPAPGTSGVPAAEAAPGTPAVPAALQFSAAGVNGSQVEGADYAGRDVALWFWAPW